MFLGGQLDRVHLFASLRGNIPLSSLTTNKLVIFFDPAQYVFMPFVIVFTLYMK
jgi:hypothetical protein